MRNKRLLAIILLFLAILSALIYYSASEKYDYAENLSYFPVPKEGNNLLTIGVIGDSWVSRGHLDSLLQKKLRDEGFEAQVFISGHHGATSKMIYQDMFGRGEKQYSSKFVIENKPKYCIVVAGVNDSFREFGEDFYVHHLRMIVEALQNYNITPIIVEIPEYGIQESQKNRRTFAIYRDELLNFFSNKENFNLKAYRDAFNENFKLDIEQKRIYVLRNTDVDLNYKTKKDLYADPLHLNKKGYNIFTDAIVSQIINLEK